MEILFCDNKFYKTDSIPTFQSERITQQKETHMCTQLCNVILSSIESEKCYKTFVKHLRYPLHPNLVRISSVNICVTPFCVWQHSNGFA